MLILLFLVSSAIVPFVGGAFADRNPAINQFDGDRLTRFLTTINRNSSSIDPECLKELIDLSIGLATNKLWALKGNLINFFVIYLQMILNNIFLSASFSEIAYFKDFFHFSD